MKKSFAVKILRQTQIDAIRAYHRFLFNNKNKWRPRIFQETLAYLILYQFVNSSIFDQSAATEDTKRPRTKVIKFYREKCVKVSILQVQLQL